MQAARMEQHVIGRSSLQGCRVLVVEDEPLIAWDLAEVLREQGAEIVGPSGNVEGALRLLATAPVVDVALLDVSLDNHESVFAVAEELRSRDIPFVFCTGYTADVTQRFGEVPHCEKPTDGAALHSALSAAMTAPACPTH
jgi:CheY-like chemotaxis protein